MIKHTTKAVLAGLVLAAATFGSNAATRTFSNTAPITIYDNARASLYPAPISVSTLGGAISDVKVTLHGFSHTYIGDLNILLVAPGGQKISLLRRYGMTSTFCCGYGSELANAEVTFSANAASIAKHVLLTYFAKKEGKPLPPPPTRDDMHLDLRDPFAHGATIPEGQ